jgi:hypothetical protein
MEMDIREKATLALKQCIATRGKYKGSLVRKAPRSDTLAYAAWQGAMLSINPYKASIGGMLFMTQEQREIQSFVTAWFDANPQYRGIDRDRRILESLGVW